MVDITDIGITLITDLGTEDGGIIPGGQGIIIALGIILLYTLVEV